MSRTQSSSTHIAPIRRLEPIEIAAARLALAPDALRARCRRHARRVGNEVIAHLGGGIVAFKLGRSWRVSFPET